MTKLDWSKAQSLGKGTGDWREYTEPKAKFSTGKYANYDIKEILETDINYIKFMLEKHPKSKISFEIIDYCSRYGV
jgi:hypothetical protein